MPALSQCAWQTIKCIAHTLGLHGGSICHFLWLVLGKEKWSDFERNSLKAYFCDDFFNSWLWHHHKLQQVNDGSNDICGMVKVIPQAQCQRHAPSLHFSFGIMSLWSLAKYGALRLEGVWANWHQCKHPRDTVSDLGYHNKGQHTLCNAIEGSCRVSMSMAGCWSVGASGVWVALTFTGANDGCRTLSMLQVGCGDFAMLQ